MTANSGRLLRIWVDGKPVSGARADNIQINNEPIDQTDKDDHGWRRFVPDAVGARAVSLTVEGVMKTDTLLAAVIGDNTALLKACSVYVQGFAGFGGDFHLNNLEIGAEQADTTTFSATLESSGAMVSLPFLLQPMVVSGDLVEDETLSLAANLELIATGIWSFTGPATFAYQWEESTTVGASAATFTNIAGATSATFANGAAQVGKYIRCRVSVTAGGVTGVAFSQIVGPIAAAPAP
jgi:predicted secreted protein